MTFVLLLTLLASASADSKDRFDLSNYGFRSAQIKGRGPLACQDGVYGYVDASCIRW